VLRPSYGGLRLDWLGIELIKPVRLCQRRNTWSWRTRSKP